MKYKKLLICLLVNGVICHLQAQQLNTNPDKTTNEIELSTIEIGDNSEVPVVQGNALIESNKIFEQQSSNITEVLEQVPGVYVSGSSRFGGQTINIWGRERVEDINFSIDGAQKGFQKYRQGSIFIDPEIVKHIIISKGPSNIESLGRGLGGTIIAKTKDPEDFLLDDRNYSARVQTGYYFNNQQKTGSLALAARTNSKKFSALLFAKRSKAGDITIPKKDSDSMDKFYAADAKVETTLLKFRYQPYVGHDLKLSLLRTYNEGWTPFASKRGYISQPTKDDIEDHNGNVVKAWQEQLVYRKLKDDSISFDYGFNPENNQLIDTSFNLSYSKTEQIDARSEKTYQFMGLTNNVSYTHFNTHLKNYARFSWLSYQHKLSMGFIYSNQDRVAMLHSIDRKHLTPDYNFGYFQIPYMPSGTQKQYSLYLGDEIKTEKMTVFLGGRYDRVENIGVPNLAPAYNNLVIGGHDYRPVTYTGISQYLRFSYKITDGLKFNSSITRTWAPPTIDSQYEVQEKNISGSRTSRQLRSEVIVSLQNGLDFSKNNLLVADDKFSASLNLINNFTRHEVFYFRGDQKSATSNIKYKYSNFQNLDKGKIYGVEASLGYETDNLRLLLQASKLSGYRNTVAMDVNKKITTWRDGTPPNKLSIEVVKKFPQSYAELGWKVDMVKRVQASMSDVLDRPTLFALNPTPSYALHSVFFNYYPNQYPSLSITARVDNLFNKYHELYLGGAVPGMGRNFKVTVGYQF